MQPIERQYDIAVNTELDDAIALLKEARLALLKWRAQDALSKRISDFLIRVHTARQTTASYATVLHVALSPAIAEFRHTLKTGERFTHCGLKWHPSSWPPGHGWLSRLTKGTEDDSTLCPECRRIALAKQGST